MAIWAYQNNSQFKLTDLESRVLNENYMHGERVLKTLGGLNCLYCKSPMNLLGKRYDGSKFEQYFLLHVCEKCGWWVITNHGGVHFGPEGSLTVRRSAGILKKFDDSDISVPTNELCQYLVKNYGNRFNIHPKRYEDIVAGVFKNSGFRVRTTSYTGDKGIDVFIMDGEGKDTVGIQVKRYKGKIEAEQIRSFAGALILNGVTKGVFVTTSSYRSGAIKTSSDYITRGLDISLWDADEFYKKLKITHRSFYSNPDDKDAAFFDFWNGEKAIPIVHSVSW
jgi:restriction system protein